MRFVDDDDLSFCLTISRRIEHDTLLRVLGHMEALPQPQSFDDFALPPHQKGKTGLLNVFEVDGHLVTLENNGFLGVAYRTQRRLTELAGRGRYLSFYYSSGNRDCQYVEVANGLILADFSPLLDEPPSVLSPLFAEGDGPREKMVLAAELRMGVQINPDWLTEKTQTYVIDYRAD